MVWFGQTREHEGMAARLLKLTANTTNAGDANCVAKLASLRPSTNVLIHEGALKLARRAVELGQKDSSLPWFQLSLAMTEYRQGHFAEAKQAALTAEEVAAKSPESHRPHIQGTARYYRAMSLFQQGNSADARQIFFDASAAMKPLPPDENNPMAAGANRDDLVLWLAYKEAKALLGSAETR
jgi:hypothetical protein